MKNWIVTLYNSSPLLIAGILFALAVLLGVGLDHLLRPAPQAVIEKPAAEQRQGDGSLVLARAPDAAAKPAQAIPKGDVVERVVQIKVKPKAQPLSAQAAQGAATPQAAPDCPATTVDLSLVKEKDGEHRVIASSPDGSIIGGVDIPVAPSEVYKARKWAIGGSYGTGRDYGAWIDRDFGRIRIGAEVNEIDLRGVKDVEGRIKIGISF